MRVSKVSAVAAAAIQITSALAQTPTIKQTIIGDPTERYSAIFGLGGHTCQQLDDTGKLHIYFEGMPNPTVLSWLAISMAAKPGVPMPQDLASELPKIPGCLPGTHHAAKARKVTLGG